VKFILKFDLFLRLFLDSWSSCHWHLALCWRYTTPFNCYLLHMAPYCNSYFGVETRIWNL